MQFRVKPGWDGPVCVGGAVRLPTKGKDDFAITR